MQPLQLTFPALFALFTSKLMPEKFHVVGVGRQPAAGKPKQTAAGLREHLCSNAGTSKAAGAYSSASAAAVCSCSRCSLRPRHGRVLRQVPLTRALSPPALHRVTRCRCSFLHANYDSAEDFALLSQHCAAIEEQMCVKCSPVAAAAPCNPARIPQIWQCPRAGQQVVLLCSPSYCLRRVGSKHQRCRTVVQRLDALHHREALWQQQPVVPGAVLCAVHVLERR